MSKEVLKPLSRDQIRYARTRVEALAEMKVRPIAEMVKEKFQWLRDRRVEILNAEIAAGRFTVPCKADLRKHKSCRELADVLRFTRYPGGVEEIDAEIKAERAVQEARIDAIRAARDEIMDGLVLSDAADALGKIEAFAAREF